MGSLPIYSIMKKRGFLFFSILLCFLSIGYGIYNYYNPKIEEKEVEVEKIIQVEKIKTEYVEKQVQKQVPIINSANFNSCLINFSDYFIFQQPELPTGCQAVSLTMVLNYLGEQVNQFEIVDKYLPKGEFGTHNPENYFLGSPYSPSGGGCFAPAIEQTVKNYNSEINVQNISGKNFSELKQYIANGSPIIFWATINMQPSVLANTFVFDGHEVEWRYYEHCLVLIGYDENQKVYHIQDPLQGLVSYDMDLVQARYNEMNKQALFVWKDEG